MRRGIGLRREREDCALANECWGCVRYRRRDGESGSVSARRSLLGRLSRGWWCCSGSTGRRGGGCTCGGCAGCSRGRCRSRDRASRSRPRGWSGWTCARGERLASVAQLVVVLLQALGEHSLGVRNRGAEHGDVLLALTARAAELRQADTAGRGQLALVFVEASVEAPASGLHVRAERLHILLAWRIGLHAGGRCSGRCGGGSWRGRRSCCRRSWRRRSRSRSLRRRRCRCRWWLRPGRRRRRLGQSQSCSETDDEQDLASKVHRRSPGPSAGQRRSDTARALRGEPSDEGPMQGPACA